MNDAAATTEDGPRRDELRRSRSRRRLAIGLLLFLASMLLLTAVAPASKTLHPDAIAGTTLLSSGGVPIARRGAIYDGPVDMATLPTHVWQPFVAIEDRRFFYHPGIDPIGIARAMWRNVSGMEMREGASTITQQLAKQAYLSSDRELGRKVQEMLLAFWLEVQLSKEEILQRYLSSAYFGDNVYGLRAAARHYFARDPEQLTVSQAALLAGLVKAPSRLAPTRDLKAARERGALVLDAMADSGMIDAAERARLEPPARISVDDGAAPDGSYFADWVYSSLPDDPDEPQRQIPTTLVSDLQAKAERAVRRVPAGAQVALVAMTPDGRVVAMVGGRDHERSKFNRATQARRQPGSTFKLFVYLAALQSGMTPDDIILDAPVTVDGWTPQNADGCYRGPITLREAFAVSSNVAAVRLAQQVGPRRVVEAAQQLGIESKLEPAPSVALGTSVTTLLEMTAAFAGIAGNRFPVTPRGLPKERDSLLDKLAGGQRSLDSAKELPMMLDLLWSAANRGTGSAAALPIPTFGKTGTSQDNRDAIFIGFAGNLVAGVWIGRDDNRPLRGNSGGGSPAEIWNAFMTSALLQAPSASVLTPGAASPGPVARRAHGDGRGRGKWRGKGRGKKKGRR